MIDHIVFGVRDLEEGVRAIEERLGVRPAAGGKHTGRGTHNALLSLGPAVYLEVIAPDPEQPRPESLPFGLESIQEPRLVSWVARATDIDRQAEAARNAGLPASVISMARELPSGERLAWRLLFYGGATPGDGLIPPLIDWDPGPHPSETAPSGGSLISLRAEHPRPDEVRQLLDALGVDLPVGAGARPALIAVIEGPRGAVELR